MSRLDIYIYVCDIYCWYQLYRYIDHFGYTFIYSSVILATFSEDDNKTHLFWFEEFSPLSLVTHSSFQYNTTGHIGVFHMLILDHSTLHDLSAYMYCSVEHSSFCHSNPCYDLLWRWNWLYLLSILNSLPSYNLSFYFCIIRIISYTRFHEYLAFLSFMFVCSCLLKLLKCKYNHIHPPCIINICEDLFHICCRIRNETCFIQRFKKMIKNIIKIQIVLLSFSIYCHQSIIAWIISYLYLIHLCSLFLITITRYLFWSFVF